MDEFVADLHFHVSTKLSINSTVYLSSSSSVSLRRRWWQWWCSDLDWLLRSSHSLSFPPFELAFSFVCGGGEGVSQSWLLMAVTIITDGRIRLPDIWHTWTRNHESETNRDTIWLKRESSSSYGFFLSCVASVGGLLKTITISCVPYVANLILNCRV